MLDRVSSHDGAGPVVPLSGYADVRGCRRLEAFTAASTSSATPAPYSLTLNTSLDGIDSYGQTGFSDPTITTAQFNSGTSGGTGRDEAIAKWSDYSVSGFPEGLTAPFVQLLGTASVHYLNAGDPPLPLPPNVTVRVIVLLLVAT